MKKYKVLKGLIFEKIDKGKQVIYDGKKSILFTFNETATFIFSKLKVGNTNNEIENELVKKYDIAKKIAKKDLKEFIGVLQKKHIISPIKTKE